MVSTNSCNEILPIPKTYPSLRMYACIVSGDQGGSEFDLGHVLPECLAVDGSDLEFELGGLARAVALGKSSCTPWGSWDEGMNE